MNILVTGANGQLGNEIRMVAQQSADCYFFTDINQVEGQYTHYLDITDYQAVREIIHRHSIECIVNCAAYTNVESAEQNFELAEQLNAIAPQNLAMAIKEVDGLLIHISTDYVFGKEPYNTPCKEEQEGTPTGVYGLTKLHGETNIKGSGCKYIIIRTSWLYSEFGHNFCKTMLNLTATKPQLKVVFDQIGTPTYALDLAKAIIDIIQHRQYEGNLGVYHYSNEGVCSWYDFAKMIAVYAGNHTCDIQPCLSSEYPTVVKRPFYSVLDKAKIKNTFGLKIPYWTDSLQQCIINLKH